MKHLRVATAALLVAMTLLALAAPAYATDGKQSTTADNEPAIDPAVVSAAVDSIVVETYDLNGNLLSTETIDGTDTLAYGSGSGGSSSASGCRKVTVKNVVKTLLQSTAYKFNTWTYWCWNRSNRTVFDVSTGWYLSDVDPNFYWREMLIDNTHYFSWYTGYPKSGYKHEKQGRVENCVPHYGCIGNTYPHNILYSYSNGTWSWYTDD